MNVTIVKGLTAGFVLGTSLMLTGCKEEAKTEQVQTIDWYKIHAKERQDMIIKCDNNPGELIDDPNCINAKKANAEAFMEARRERIKRTSAQ